MDFDDVSLGFPGFAEAIAGSSPDIASYVHKYGSGWDNELQHVGAEDFRIISLQDSPSETTADVCAYRDRGSFSSEREPTTYSVGISDEDASQLHRITFEKAGIAPDDQQSGTSARPKDASAFGAWKVMNFDYGFLAQHTVTETDAARARCESERGEIPRIPREVQRIPASPGPAPIQPYPGWSDAPAV